MTKAQRRHQQEYRRFFKLVVRLDHYGALYKRKMWHTDPAIQRSKDIDIVEENYDGDFYDWFIVAYVRDDVDVYGGRPKFNGHGWFNKWYYEWQSTSYAKSQERFVKAAQARSDARMRQVEEETALRLRELRNDEADRAAAIIELEKRLDQEDARRKEQRRIDAILQGPSARAIPKGVMAFFQMTAAAQAVTNYVSNQNETDTYTKDR